MRTLKFIVNGQIIEKDPKCDFSNLVPGSEGYLRAEFSFSSEWKDCRKAAAFYSVMGKEFQPQMLENGTWCMIPAEACAKRDFKIRVIGMKPDYKISTNKITVSQNGGNA